LSVANGRIKQRKGRKHYAKKAKKQNAFEKEAEMQPTFFLSDLSTSILFIALRR